MKRCPKCGSEVFIVTQHVTQTVKVDGDGHYLSTVTECDVVTHASDNDDIWVCDNCGFDAAGSDFEAN